MRAVRQLMLAMAMLLQLGHTADSYYSTLGVSSNAGQSAIKRAYRKLSLKHHPDKATGDKDLAEKAFVEVAKAYEVLSDPKKRKVYDEQGEEGLKQMGQGAAGGGMNPFDVFRNFGFGQAQQQQEGAGEGPALEVELKVSLKDLYLGTSIAVLVSRTIPAEDADDEHSCRTCHFHKQEIEHRQIAPGFVQQVQKQVRQDYRCCVQEDVVEVEVERGVPDGHVIELEGSGEYNPSQTPGKVRFQVSVGEDGKFQRKGHHLHTEMSISLKEALVGFRRTLTHADGATQVSVERDEVTHPDQVVMYRGMGMPQHGTPSITGDLYVKFHILFPKQVSAEQKTQLRNLLRE